MEFIVAKQQFLQTWGKLGSEWGINRTMAQVHALLLISPKPLSTEEIMQELQISRGNAHLNLRELMNWTLVDKELLAGERKEYFKAEKNLWEVARRIAKGRKRREIEPVLQVLKQVQHLDDADESNPDTKEFLRMMKQLEGLVGKFDTTTELLIKAEETWVFQSIMKLFN